MENFWSLLKCGLHGTYIGVEPFHLFRYIDEQAFRYNTQKMEGGDSDRFKAVMKQIVGKRLTYEPAGVFEHRISDPLRSVPTANSELIPSICHELTIIF